MNFGKALEAVKDGKKIFRLGWNGKGMFVVYQKGYPDGIPCNLQTAKAWGMNEGDLFKCEPYLQIKTADGSHAMWVPSIGDMEKAVDPQIEMQKIEVPEEKTEPPSGMSNETRKRLDEMYEKFGVKK